MLFSRPSGAEILIVFLGNPGDKYEFTRHNAGFLCGDYVADKLGFSFNKIKFRANYGTGEIGGEKCVFLKPQTYMNESGYAVAEAASFYKIPPEKIIVVSDDISLPVGKMRIRRKGSAGGHNGLKSIIASLGTEDFPRIKVGIGGKVHPDQDLADHVLSSFTKDELKILTELYASCFSALEYIVNGDFDTAMQKYN